MLSLSIFVALILIDVCAALQPKSGGGRSTFIGLKYITYWIQNKNDKDCGPLKETLFGLDKGPSIKDVSSQGEGGG